MKDKTIVNIPQDVLNKIHLMHKNTPLNTEWSGVTVFIESEDKFKNGLPKEVYLEDIIPMNRGNYSYTDFSMGTSPVFTEYILRDENIGKEFNTGLIHTHHNMRAYFSGTDMEELRDNAQHYPYYLSIIVNYKMDIVAKIGVATKDIVTVTKLSYVKNLKGDYVPFGNKPDTKTEKFSCVDFDCDIVLPKEDKKFLELVSILDKQEVEQLKKVSKFSKKSKSNHLIGDFLDEGLDDMMDMRGVPDMFSPFNQDQNLGNKAFDDDFIEIPVEDWEIFMEEIEEVEENFQIPEKLKYLLNGFKQYM